MIILLQNATIQFRRLSWRILYCKLRQSNFIANCDRLLLQNVSGITKCDRQLLQNVSGIIKCNRLLLQSASGISKCDRLYHKVRQVLQSVTVITKRDVTLSNAAKLDSGSRFVRTAYLFSCSTERSLFLKGTSNFFSTFYCSLLTPLKLILVSSIIHLRFWTMVLNPCLTSLHYQSETNVFTSSIPKHLLIAIGVPCASHPTIFFENLPSKPMPPMGNLISPLT